MTPNNTPEPKQFPAPVTPPPKGLLHLILRHRFFVVALVAVLFLGSLFALGSRHGGSTPSKPAKSSVAAPHGEPAAAVPKEPALKPLMPAPSKGAPEAGSPAAPVPQLRPTNPRRPPPKPSRALSRRPPRPW